MKQTLSDAAKSLMNFNDDMMNQPITFGTTVRSAKTEGPVTEYRSVERLTKIPTVVWDAVRYLKLTDCAEFDAFLATKKSSNTIVTDNDIFDKFAFEADVKALEREYNNETEWLKSHTPKSPAEQSSWSERLRKRDALRLVVPRKEDPKYHSKEKVVVTFNGAECKSIIAAFKSACNEIESKYVAIAKQNYVEQHVITMDEETFKFIKTMRRLGQFDLNKIPATEIRSGYFKTDAVDDLNRALLNFETISEYNDSLKDYAPQINSADMDSDRVAVCNSDVVMAAPALLSYCIEFKALKDLESKGTATVAF